MARTFRRHLKYFGTLCCNLIDADGQDGVLNALFEWFSLYMEKSLALETQIKLALIYPISVLMMASLVTVVLMISVVSPFKGVFSGFSVDLPAPTLLVITMSDLFVK